MRTIILVALCLVSSAQANPLGDRFRARGGNPPAMLQSLGVTPQQVQQIQPILVEAAAQLQSVQSNSALTPVQKQEQRNQIMLQAAGRCAPLLTPEQRSNISQLLNSLGKKLGSE